MITSNHISELLKMQIESKSQNVHTQGTLSGFISKHAVTTQKSINMRDSHKVIIALSLCLSSGALQHTVNTSIIAAKMVQIFFFPAPLFRSGLEARSNKNSNTNPVSTKCRLQTADRVQNAD